LAVAAVAMAASSTRALEIVETSGDTRIAQGSSGLMYCKSDVPYEFCKWTNADKGLSCRTSSGEASHCGEDDHLSWEVDEVTCGLRIDSASRLNDVGDYTCILSVFTDEGVFTDTAHISLDVAVQSLASFAGDFAGSEETSVHVVAENEVSVQCSASAGFPAPKVRAFLGPNKDEVNDQLDGGSDVELEMVDEASTESEEDGTVGVTGTFKLVPNRDDCGSYVKCVVEQHDGDGNQVGDAAPFISRKIMVTFAALPKPSQEFTFTDDDDIMLVRLDFMANPLPEDAQVTWHIIPSGAEEVAAEEAVAEEAVADEAVAEDAVAEEAIAEETVAEEAVAEDEADEPIAEDEADNAFAEDEADEAFFEDEADDAEDEFDDEESDDAEEESDDAEEESDDAGAEATEDEASEDSDKGSIVILTPNSSVGKYTSPELTFPEDMGHMAQATLEITELSPEMAEWSYYMLVTNEVGEQRYDFTLRYIAPEVVTEEVAVADAAVEAGAEANDNSETGKLGKVDQEEAKGMSSGGVVVIVILVLAILAGVIAVVVAKKKNLWCFGYKAVPTKAGDAEAGGGNEYVDKPIIKNGSKQDLTRSDVTKNNKNSENSEKKASLQAGEVKEAPGQSSV